ncbi:serine hydrolase [Umezawaea endophytica]|uniref:Beta-lactamase n=1 Tax=Umezawaea endophytica TaxID=1654476 RepID=A0A9X2VS30_9PSEU|nr:serine hydrolase [Umezawaea endophytica]MCS7481791.1 class A beta-lactamase-related serine hydrolase [Umezawaea endophytica]
MNITRRFALGLGSAAAASAVLGSGTAAAQDDEVDTEPELEAVVPRTAEVARRKIARKYRLETRRARGTWSSYIGVANPDGSVRAAVEEHPDTVVEAYSVNKIAVAVTVLDKVDRGLLTLDQRIELTADIVIHDTDGIFGLDGAYPSSITVGHVLSALLTVSDNTAVRLCGLLVPAREINDILRGKGFVHTQVVPVANPNRYYLGTTTPRETFTLLRKLVNEELLSPASTTHLLTVLRSLTSFTDGVRLELSSNERLQVATKAGWFADGRNEAGVVFDADGKPVITFALFASGRFRGDETANNDNYSATHPALRARAAIGRTLFDSVRQITCPAPRPRLSQVYRPWTGA